MFNPPTVETKQTVKASDNNNTQVYSGESKIIDIELHMNAEQVAFLCKSSGEKFFSKNTLV